MAANRMRSKSTRVTIPGDMGTLMPTLKAGTERREIVYDNDTTMALLEVMPALSPVYAYTACRKNLIMALGTRYPNGRPELSDVSIDDYARFLVLAIRDAPQGLSVTMERAQVPSHFQGEKRKKYEKALAEMCYDTAITRMYNGFVKLEVGVGKYKAPRVI